MRVPGRPEAEWLFWAKDGWAGQPGVRIQLGPLSFFESYNRAAPIPGKDSFFHCTVFNQYEAKNAC